MKKRKRKHKPYVPDRVRKGFSWYAASVCTLAAVGGTSTVLIGVAIASSSAMILPISTPPNALAYATNLIQQKDMARMGVIIGVISIVLGYLVLFAAGSLHIV